MIYPTLARLIVREHLYKPLHGKVLLLGRQKIPMSYEEALKLFQQEGCTPVPLKEEDITINLQTRGATAQDFMSDTTFFKMLGVTDLVSIDISDFESPDILHNLNYPVPESLHGQFDFIVDGGTFDHFVDIRVALENVVRMLNTGGRIFQWNAASNFTGSAYISFGPDFFYDYYVLNQFADCKVYLAEVDNGSQGQLWDFYEFEGAEKSGHFVTPRIVMTLVLAEKGPSSTWDNLPVQAQYRDDNLWGPYRAAQVEMAKSGRKPLMGSGPGQTLETWEYRRKKTSPVARAGQMASSVKEKGLRWGFKRAVAKTSLRLNRCGNFLRRKTGMTTGRIVQGYRYVGKI